MCSEGPHHESQYHILHLLQLSQTGGLLQKGTKYHFTAFSSCLSAEDIKVKTLYFPFWAIYNETYCPPGAAR